MSSHTFLKKGVIYSLLKTLDALLRSTVNGIVQCFCSLSWTKIKNNSSSWASENARCYLRLFRLFAIDNFLLSAPTSESCRQHAIVLCIVWPLSTWQTLLISSTGSDTFTYLRKYVTPSKGTHHDSLLRGTCRKRLCTIAQHLNHHLSPLTSSKALSSLITVWQHSCCPKPSTFPRTVFTCTLEAVQPGLRQYKRDSGVSESCCLRLKWYSFPSHGRLSRGRLIALRMHTEFGLNINLSGSVYSNRTLTTFTTLGFFCAGWSAV